MKDDVVCAVIDEEETFFVKNKRIKGMYHGTGDVFASALIGAYQKEKTLKDSVEFAAWYVFECIKITKERYGESHYGVDFESVLGDFIEKIR